MTDVERVLPPVRIANTTRTVATSLARRSDPRVVSESTAQPTTSRRVQPPIDESVDPGFAAGDDDDAGAEWGAGGTPLVIAPSSASASRRPAAPRRLTLGEVARGAPAPSILDMRGPQLAREILRGMHKSRRP